jgi:hypothetical protein
MVNRDTSIDISDGVAILNFLYAGTAVLDCLDAADVDDSGDVQLNDAVRLFNHLFLGGPAPNLPYPAAGADPTPDGLPACERP